MATKRNITTFRKKKRKRKHGFLKRKQTKPGKNILKRRRKKGRYRLSP